ncbi:hypothetical protein B484DRAFT_252704, partial [Ochromonadaceae sp. CCMP2298]
MHLHPHVTHTGQNAHNVHISAATRWPRISELAHREGVETFLSQYCHLFGLALAAGRPDFLQEFLSLSPAALVKSNSLEGCAGLLRQAVDIGDTAAVRVIVQCWCTFLATPLCSELLYSPDVCLSMPDMLALAATYPKEFERLICSLRFMPVGNNQMRPGELFMTQGAHLERYEAPEEYMGMSVMGLLSAKQSYASSQGSQWGLGLANSVYGPRSADASQASLASQGAGLAELDELVQVGDESGLQEAAGKTKVGVWCVVLCVVC